MGNNYHLKAAFCLLMLCTMSMLFYAGNMTYLENESGGTYMEVSYEQLNISGTHIITHRLIDLERTTHLQLMCHHLSKESGYETTNSSNLDHILVDEKHRLLYCYVPKVACTNWKRVFMILTGKSNVTDLLTIPASVAHGKGVFRNLSSYPSSEINHFLKNYTKFLFVRHPFERLLSAYRNKLEQHYLSSKYFQSRFGRHIIKKYRKYPTKEALLNGDDVTFYEFASYLTNPKDVIFNEHWKPVYQLCHPCFINYNIIGKYETLYEDSKHILEMSGGSDIAFPQSKKTSSTSSILKKYFNSLPKELIKKLYEIYLFDFKLFGYSLQGFLDGEYR